MRVSSQKNKEQLNTVVIPVEKELVKSIEQKPMSKTQSFMNETPVFNGNFNIWLQI